MIGIDWATSEGGRALVELAVTGDGLRVVAVRSAVADTEPARLVAEKDVRAIALDIPFGWPRGFAKFMAAQTKAWSEPPEWEDFRYRCTERVVQIHKTPLSVAADKFAMGAWAWARIVHKDGLDRWVDLGTSDPSPSPSIIEVYPAASAIALVEREKPGAQVLALLVDRFELDVDGHQEALLRRRDELDALLAAMTAAIHLGHVRGSLLRDKAGNAWDVRRPKTPEERTAASAEGWIFFPERPESSS